MWSPLWEVVSPDSKHQCCGDRSRRACDKWRSAHGVSLTSSTQPVLVRLDPLPPPCPFRSRRPPLFRHILLRMSMTGRPSVNSLALLGYSTVSQMQYSPQSRTRQATGRVLPRLIANFMTPFADLERQARRLYVCFRSGGRASACSVRRGGAPATSWP